MSCSQTFEWFGHFKKGRTSTVNDGSIRSAKHGNNLLKKWHRYGRLSTRIVVVPYTISVQRLELVTDLVSELSQNS